MNSLLNSNKGRLLFSIFSAATLFFMLPQIGMAQTTYTMSNSTYSGGDELTFIIANSTASGSGTPTTIVIPVGVSVSITSPQVLNLTTISGDVIIEIQGSSAYPGGGGQLFFDGNNASLTINTGDGISINSSNTTGLDAFGGNQIKVTTDGTNYDRNALPNLIAAGGVSGNGTLGAPLPIELVSFTASLEGKQIHLKWTTVSEINNRGFGIEKSSDGIVWREIGWKDGSGFSHEKVEYQFVDNQPFNGNNYYRLAQYDFDGEMEISAIRSVAISNNESVVTVFPSPASEVLRFKSSSDSEIESVKIFNQLGQHVLHQLFPGNEIGIGGLDAGAYMIEMLVEGRKSTSRFIVK